MSKYIMCNECKMCDGDRCTYFDNDSDRESTLACILFEPKNPSLFHQITASPEALAESVVYPYEMAVGGSTFRVYWTSPFVENFYPDKSEAFAATLARLNAPAESEVKDD